MGQHTSISISGEDSGVPTSTAAAREAAAKQAEGSFAESVSATVKQRLSITLGDNGDGQVVNQGPSSVTVASEPDERDLGDLSGVQPFGTPDELVRAMADPRYRTDAWYRREVLQRLAKGERGNG